MNELAVAAVQLSSQADVPQNLARVRHWVGRAAEAGAKLVALPENFALMGEDDTQKRGVAERLDVRQPGPILGTIVELARAHHVFIVAGGMPEQSGDHERPFNTSLLVTPSGEIAAAYRKIHLFDVDLPDGTKATESSACSSGPARAEPPVDVLGAPVGMTICYDLRFPELYRALTSLGARVVTVPAAFTLATGKDHWRVLLQARAIENQIFIVAPAQVGKHPRGRQTYGKSLIADPWGDVLAQSGDGEGFALARLDFAAQDRVRGALPCLTHRRLV